MKQIIALGFGLLIATVGFGQVVTPNSTNRGPITLYTAAQVDSAVAANTANVFLSNRFIGGTHSFSAVAKVTRNSGTVAGKVYLEGSHDGIDYAPLDSFTLNNMTRVIKFSLVGEQASYGYYGIRLVTSGSQNSTIKAKMQGKTPPYIIR